MKKGSILICGTALAIMLGLGFIQPQNVQADSVATVSDSQVESNVSDQSTDDPVIVPTNDNNQDSNTDTNSLPVSVTAQLPGEKIADPSENTATDKKTESDYPGGDWSVDPTTATPQENFYYYVNGKWQESAEIPASQSQVGVTDEMQNKVKTEMIKDLNDFSDGQKTPETSQLQQAADFYKKALTTMQEKQSGYDSVKKDIQKINDLQNLDDFGKMMPEFTKDGMPMPFFIQPEVGLKDATKEILAFAPAGTILPDKSYYDNDDDGTIMLSRYSAGANQVLNLFGYSDEQANKMVEQTLAYDRLINQYTSEPTNALDDPDAFYHPMDVAKFEKSFKSLNIADYLKVLYPTNDSDIDITDEQYLKNINLLVNPHNFDMLKSWMIVSTLTDNAVYLGQDTTDAMAPYIKKLSGVSQMPNNQKRAYTMTGSIFEQVLSQYYGKTYFGEEAKQDATRLIDNILGVYHERIQNNTWLSDATKQNALDKLAKISLKVAYPETVPDYYADVNISENENLYDTVKAYNEAYADWAIDQFTKPVDHSIWSMPSYLVNAQYDPQSNDVTVPAAILQAPFYDVKQTDSQNYGGIGATIGHEISHAFDNSGAQFDKNGNLDNWWTKTDYDKFQKLTQKMADEFDGIPYAGGKVDGTATVGENMADNGGLNVALQAAKAEPNFDAKQFFESWAKSWRFKATPDYEKKLLAIDVHSPQPLRVTVALQNLDDFYTTYDIKPGDAMWLAPADRVNIW